MLVFSQHAIRWFIPNMFLHSIRDLVLKYSHVNN